MNRGNVEGQRPQAARRPNDQHSESWLWSFEDVDRFLSRPSAFSREHRKLCLAMLEGVIRDVVQHRDYGSVVPIGASGRPDRLAATREAETRRLHEYLDEEARDHSLSLRSVCHALELDEDWIRGGLTKLLASAPGQKPPRGAGVLRRAHA